MISKREKPLSASSPGSDEETEIHRLCEYYQKTETDRISAAHPNWDADRLEVDLIWRDSSEKASLEFKLGCRVTNNTVVFIGSQDASASHIR